jgi:hypothetical protein
MFIEAEKRPHNQYVKKVGCQKYRLFEKELYNFENLYTFIQRTCTEFYLG